MFPGIEKLKEFRILYVDDDREVATTMEGMFKFIFKDVRIAYDGEEGLRTFLADPVDLVITDVTMPRMDGIEMARRLRPGHPAVRILFITGHHEEDLKMECYHDGVITKPVSAKVLFRELKRIFAIPA